MPEQSELLAAAIAMLARLDEITTDEFRKGGDQPEREALRNAIAASITPMQALRGLYNATRDIIEWRAREGIADIKGDKFSHQTTVALLAGMVLEHNSA